MLQKINSADINVYHDLYLTALNLSDYDWMHYVFHARLTLSDKFIEIVADYFGIVTTQISLKIVDYSCQVLHECKFEIPTDIFDDFRKTYLTEHIKSIGSDCAFCGHEIATDFYNKLVDIYNSDQ